MHGCMFYVYTYVNVGYVCMHVLYYTMCIYIFIYDIIYCGEGVRGGGMIRKGERELNSTCIQLNCE
jgi:hypothetical protein